MNKWPKNTQVVVTAKILGNASFLFKDWFLMLRVRKKAERKTETRLKDRGLAEGEHLALKMYVESVTVQVIREVGRTLISLALLCLAFFLYYWARESSSSGASIGLSQPALLIVEAELWYWLIRPARRI